MTAKCVDICDEARPVPDFPPCSSRHRFAGNCSACSDRHAGASRRPGRVPTRDGVVQALIDDLIERGLNPAVPRLFIIDGSKALAKARGLKVRAAR